MKVKVINKSEFTLPKYETLGSAGMDIRYNGEDITINPKETKLLKTGLFVAIPKGYEIQVRARSSLALKRNLIVTNGVGTIDSDYRHEIGVIISNIGEVSQTLKKGVRIAQLVLNKVPNIEWEEVENLNETERKGGFGSTGEK